MEAVSHIFNLSRELQIHEEYVSSKNMQELKWQNYGNINWATANMIFEIVESRTI